jgi:ADP-heptose:LPS heptosyltransferase
LNVEKWLMVNFKLDRLPDKHIVDRYFDAVNGLGVKNDGKGLEYFIPEEDQLGIADLPAGFDRGFIAFVIGGMHFTKMLPEEKVLELLGYLEMPVALLGGPTDRERANRIVEASGKNIYNACGELNINQSAAVISMASKVLTNDTGLMHIAAAFHKEIYSFWGNTIPAFGMYPYLPEGESRSHIMEVKGLSCRPCSKIGHASCPKKHFRCMMDLDMAALAGNLNT